jgi:hypothetical protein
LTKIEVRYKNNAFASMMPLSSVDLRTGIFSDQMTAILDRRPVTGHLLLVLIILSMTPRVAVKSLKCSAGPAKFTVKPPSPPPPWLHNGNCDFGNPGFSVDEGNGEISRGSFPAADLGAGIWSVRLWRLWDGGQECGQQHFDVHEMAALDDLSLACFMVGERELLDFLATIACCGTCGCNIFTYVRDLSFLYYRF